MVAVGLGDDLVFTLGAAVAERIETQSSESPNADRAKQQKPCRFRECPRLLSIDRPFESAHLGHVWEVFRSSQAA